MLAQDQIHDLDADFLNIDSFFVNNDDEHEGEGIA